MLCKASARNIHTAVSLCFPLRTFAPSQSRLWITCQWSPCSNLVWCKHTLSHMISTWWVDWELVSSVCKTQTHSWKTMCRKLDTFQLKTLSLVSMCVMFFFVLFLQPYYRVSCSDLSQNIYQLARYYLFWSICDLLQFIIYLQTMQHKWACTLWLGLWPNQNSKRRQIPVFDNKFLEFQSVAVRNMCQTLCIMNGWPIADMNVHWSS